MLPKACQTPPPRGRILHTACFFITVKGNTELEAFLFSFTLGTSPPAHLLGFYSESILTLTPPHPSTAVTRVENTWLLNTLASTLAPYSILSTGPPERFTDTHRSDLAPPVSALQRLFSSGIYSNSLLWPPRPSTTRPLPLL